MLFERKFKITVVVTEKEKKDIIWKAKKYGFPSVAEFLRKICLSFEGK